MIQGMLGLTRLGMDTFRITGLKGYTDVIERRADTVADLPDLDDGGGPDDDEVDETPDDVDFMDLFYRKPKVPRSLRGRPRWRAHTIGTLNRGPQRNSVIPYHK